MTDLPTKDDIVERVNPDLDAIHYRDIEAALDALTVPDLLALLRERGCEIGTAEPSPFVETVWVVTVTKATPDD